MEESKRSELEQGSIGTILIKYAAPSVISMLFFGLQSLIDGIVVGNYIGDKALGGINIILPLFSVLMVVSLTVGIGCQTVVGHGLGANDIPKAQKAMTTGFWALTAISIVCSGLLWLFAEPFIRLLGANDVLMPYSVGYFKGLVPFLLPVSLCFYSDLMLKAMGRPIASTVIMSLVVVLNIILSLIFVIYLDMGTMGASLATSCAFTIGLFVSGRFTFDPKQTISMLKGKFCRRILFRAMYNGSSEGVSELSSAISILIINNTMIKMVGAEGVSTYTVISYINFIGILIFIGISDGLIPVMSYNYGARNYSRLLGMTKFVARINLIIGVLIFLFLHFFGNLAIDIFLNKESSRVMSMAQSGLRIFSFVFLVNGLNILITSFFTSIGNALGSIVVAMLRGVVFIALGIMILPPLLGEQGIWLTIASAEFLTFVVAAILFASTIKRLKKKDE